MKTYELIRDVDDSGVSGTGKVAEACVFSNGRCVIAWVGSEKTGIQSIVVYDSLGDAEKIHGHGAHTRFVQMPSAPPPQGKTTWQWIYDRQWIYDPR